MNQHVVIHDAVAWFGPDDDVARFRRMADYYCEMVDAHPTSDRCLIALRIGAIVFQAPAEDIISTRRGRRAVQSVRMKLMAFTRVVSEAYDPHPNKLISIGHAFRRDYSTVISAIHQFRPAVERALLP